eukprot:7405730-Pyramimonas_sp.AAC.1
MGTDRGTCRGDALRNVLVTSVSVETSCPHPHARHPPGRAGHVKTNVLLNTSSTHPHARHPPGRTGH